MITVKRTALCIALALSLFFNQEMSGALFAAGQIVKVPVGTPVIVESIGEINSKNVSPGEKIIFKVMSDVTVEGKVVVKAGASAVGQVTEALAASHIGIPGAITIALQTVQAVDDSLVPISATKGVKGESKLVLTIVISVLCCILFLLLKGKDVSIPQGTSISAFVTAPAEVRVH